MIAEICLLHIELLGKL